MRQQLKVQGMHCASCAMLIDEELEELDGVRQATTSYVKQKTEVEFDDARVGIGSIIAKVAELGYSAEPAQES